MASEYTSQSNMEMTIPDYVDLVDFPDSFTLFSEDMIGQSYVSSVGTSSITVADINSIIPFHNESEGDPVESTLVVESDASEDRKYFESVGEKEFGFQFAIKTQNNNVTIDDANANFLPSNEVGPFSFVIITRVDANNWFVTGGSSILEKP
jgi:hypothetical protein